MVDRPQLANYVNFFTWTLVWRGYEGDHLTEIDFQTWAVFSELIKVSHLDLASLYHYDNDDHVRQNPATLFPEVRDLRLLGWMHRALVTAILTSLDSSKLWSLQFDYLQDEGALPNGEFMDRDL